MEPTVKELAERDQLWAALRTLRTDIEALAVAGPDGSERQGKVASILARVVLSELDFRARTTEPG